MVASGNADRALLSLDRKYLNVTFTNAAKSGGKDGAEPGGHADLEEARKYVQYTTIHILHCIFMAECFGARVIRR